MALREQIQRDRDDSRRAKDTRRLGAIQLLLAAIKQREVDERITLDDTQILTVIEKMLRQRRDSLTQYQKAGRQDLIDQESYEITLLEGYLPEQLAAGEIEDLIHQTLQEIGATSVKDMGKVMAALKPKIQGRADVSAISKKIKSALET